jgi:hypothetical protein
MLQKTSGMRRRAATAVSSSSCQNIQSRFSPYFSWQGQDLLPDFDIAVVFFVATDAVDLMELLIIVFLGEDQRDGAP